MPSPLPRHSDWGYSSLILPNRVSLPRYGSRVGLRIDLFEACSAFTRVTACTLALSPYFVTRFIRRLQPLRYLHDCSVASGWSGLPGGACTHWKAPPYHGARQKQSFNGATQFARKQTLPGLTVTTLSADHLVCAEQEFLRHLQT